MSDWLLYIKFVEAMREYIPALHGCQLTFPEQSIPALQWILWRREQTLETELQSLAHIHPSHLGEEYK